MCWHKWKVVSKETQESAFDQLIKAGLSSFKNIYADMFERSVIITYKCEKCEAEKVERV